MAKVRIRRAGPGETAGYYNKTAMYLKKAQMRQEVQAEEGQGQTQDEMVQAYYMYAEEQLSNDMSPDKVYTELVSNGLPEKIAYQMITSLMDKLVDEGVVNPDYKRNKEDQAAEEQKSQEQQGQQEQAPAEPSADQQQQDQSMFEEDQAAADAEEGYIQDRSYMQDGGYTEDELAGQSNIMDQYNQVKDNDTEQFDFQELISKTPGIQAGLNFPSLSEYIPDYQELKWNNIDALQPTQDDQNSSQQLDSQRVGGMVRKKQFVKNVMSLLKKQAGGDAAEQPMQPGQEAAPEEENKDTTLGKGNPMDTLTEDVQKHKNNFLGALKTKATTVKTEEMYDKLKKSNDPALQQMGMQGEQPEQQPFHQTGGMTGGQDPLFKFLGGGQDFQEDPNYYEADFLPEAKYGYSTGNLRRAKDGVGVGLHIETVYTNPPTYIVRDEDGKEVFSSKNPGEAQSFKDGNKESSNSGTHINPATGKAFTKEEWDAASANNRKIVEDATNGMSKRQKEAWIQQQLYLRQQQPRVNADGIPMGRYIPHYVTTPGTSLRSLTPWNPIFQSSGFTAQRGNPYMYGTNTPYMDPLTGMKPVARQVTKRGMFGRPKRYTDIYSISGFQGGQDDKGNGNIIADGNTLIFPQRDSKGHIDISNQERNSVTRGLSANAQEAIRMGDRQMDRNDRRLARHPELLDSGVDNKTDEQDVQEFQARQKAQGKVWNEQTGRWEIAKTEASDPNNTMLLERNQPIETEREQPIQPEQGGNNVGPMVDGEMAYGGYIPQGRWMPKASGGIEINDPSAPQPQPGNPDLAMGTQQAGFMGDVTQGPNSSWGAMQSFNAPPPAAPASIQAYNNDPMNNMTVEPEGDDLSNCTEEQKRDTTSKCYQAGQQTKLVGVDFERSKNKTIDPEAGVNVLNAGVRGVTGFLNRKDEKRKEKQMYDNLSSDNLYASQSTKHRGDWVDIGSQAGQYRFDQMGQDRSGFSSYGKYGGYMQDGGEQAYLSGDDFPSEDPQYNEGDEVYMTEDDVKNFMANGGQIEYL